MAEVLASRTTENGQTVVLKRRPTTRKEGARYEYYVTEQGDDRRIDQYHFTKEEGMRQLNGVKRHYETAAESEKRKNRGPSLFGGGGGFSMGGGNNGGGIPGVGMGSGESEDADTKDQNQGHPLFGSGGGGNGGGEPPAFPGFGMGPKDDDGDDDDDGFRFPGLF